MYVNLTNSGFFKLFQQIEQVIRRSSEIGPLLKNLVEVVGWHFGLDRCVVMLLELERQELKVAAEFHEESLKALVGGRYQLSTNSEWHRLLVQGKPLLLKDISLQAGEPGALPELEQFFSDSQSKSLVAFPLVNAGQLIGTLSVHYCREATGFSEDFLAFGESLAVELAQGIDQLRLFKERDLESRVFREANLPMLVLDVTTCQILQANTAALKFLNTTGRSLDRLSFLDFMGGSDGARIQESYRRLLAGETAVRLDGLVLRSADGEPQHLDACLSLIHSGAQGSLLVVLLPGLFGQPERDLERTADGKGGSKVEELLAAMTRQLHWERTARQLAVSLSSKLDRDAILQSAVDLLGRAVGASRALIVKTEGPASPMVTHEFAVPDISPLGLGRTSQFPASAVNCFRSKSAAWSDISAGVASLETTPGDLHQLVESGVVGMCGCPVGHHGQYQGLILVLQTDSARHWSAYEIDLLETVANQMAISLVHAHAYSQIKDQLFNMNLIGNLTQQLTNALDLASRQARSDGPPESVKQSGGLPPLSSRELEVLRLIASGLANREIAQRLFLTESTVELHASRIRKKLKLKSRTALVKYACDNHLV
jgi:GAF domain-containing protein